MTAEPFIRFRSADAALFFYFRAGELLAAKASLRLHPEGQIPGTGGRRRDDLVDDYLTIATCLKALSELERWLLGALYKPINFGEPRRSVSRACDEGRRMFPRVRWTLQGVGRLRCQTVATVERRLADKHLIPRPAPGRAGSMQPDPWRGSEPTHQGGNYGSGEADVRLRDGTLRRTARKETGAQARRPQRRREVVFGPSGARG